MLAPMSIRFDKGGVVERAGALHATAAGPLVLVVDDDEDQRLTVSEILEDEGYRVDQAANGKLALERLLARDQILPSVMLLDLFMPVMSGWELLSVVGAYLRLARVPVVLLSGADEGTSHHPITGVSAVLQKPYGIVTLLETVRKAIGSRSQP
jgi:CheY-like chemotaxis protein